MKSAQAAPATPLGLDEEHPALGRLEPANLRTRARAAIRTHIITGQLRPGVIYPVSYFADRFGVSATPVREALLDLSNLGLVELVRNKGYRVPDLSEHELDEIYQLRLLIEVPAISQMIGRFDPGSQRQCADLAAAIEHCAAQGDLVGFLEADRQFHATLLRPLGNERLVRLVNELRDGARLWALPSLATSAELMASAREHGEILRAVISGNAVEAASLAVRHLEHTRGLWVGHTEGV